VHYSADGSICATYHFQHGRLNDTPDGKPAITEFYPNGAVNETSRLIDDVERDMPDGTPAQLRFSPDGTISGGWSATTGQELTAKEARDAIQAALSNRLQQAVDASVPGVEIVGMHSPQVEPIIDSRGGRVI